MATVLDKKHFFRLKAAFSDLIDKAGGIERAAVICGYGKSTVGRWASRNDPDMMPTAAVIALEVETGSPIVTLAMCSLHGLETSAHTDEPTHVMGAFVQVSQHASGLSAEIGMAMSDGIISPREQDEIDHKARDLQGATEKLRAAIASMEGKPMKVVA